MDKFTKALATAIRIAWDKDYVDDIITFDLDGDYEGFCAKFKEIFGEELYE